MGGLMSPAASSAPASVPDVPKLMPWLWGIAAVWCAVVALAASAGVFAARGTPPIALGLAVAVPPLLVVALLAWSPAFRAWAAAADLRALTTLQTWRVAGFGFVTVWAVGDLPGAFALPAGLGDILIGLTAPLVAARWTGPGRSARRIFYAWTALGVLDLLLAVTLGVLHSPTRLGVLAAAGDTAVMATLPMSLIPTFVVPAMLAIHAISVFNTRHA